MRHFHSALLLAAALVSTLLTSCGSNPSEPSDANSNGSWPPVNSQPFAENLPDEFFLGSMAQKESVVYFFGGRGHDGEVASRQVRAFDMAAGTWRHKATMKFARSNAAALAVGDYIYVIGGRGNGGGDTMSRKFERYDIATDAWETLPDITMTRYDGIDPNAFVALNGKLYTISTRRLVENSLTLYEWDGQGWKAYTFQRPSSAEPTLAASNSRIYIFDREGAGNYMYEFDPATGNIVTRQAPKFNERGYANGWFHHEGKIYKINSHENAPQVMEIYDIAADTWRRIEVPYSYNSNAVFRPVVTNATTGEVFFCSMPDIRKGFHFNPMTEGFSTR